MNFKLLFLLVLAVTPTYADSFSPPTTNLYFSDNHKYCMIVIPGRRQPNFHSVPNDMRIEIPGDLGIHDGAYGVFFREGIDSVYRPVWRACLPHYTSPSRVMVQNDGLWVVMIDNYAFHGYGDDVLVIFDSTGWMTQNFALSELYPPAKVKSFPRTSSSRWWLIDARFIDSLGQLELRSISNGPSFLFSELCLGEDYLTLDLATGRIVSFRSKFDEILDTYSESRKVDDYWRTMRYFYYLMNNPEPSLCVCLDSLDFEGNQFDSLRVIYNGFLDRPFWELGAALQSFGRDVRFMINGIGIQKPILLVESHDIEFGSPLLDSFPVVVRLPSGKDFFPLAPDTVSLPKAILHGGNSAFYPFYSMEYAPDGSGLRFPLEGFSLSAIVTVDSTIIRGVNIGVENIAFGTRVFIDLTR